MEELFAERIDNEFKTAWTELLRLSQAPNKEKAAAWNPGISAGKIVIISHFLQVYSQKAAEKTSNTQVKECLYSITRSSAQVVESTKDLLKALSTLAKYAKEAEENSPAPCGPN